MNCDHCGKTLVTDGVQTEKSSLYDAAEEAEWREINGRHYCPECYEVDDNDDYVPIGNFIVGRAINY